jgi:hypothetical protein
MTSSYGSLPTDRITKRSKHHRACLCSATCHDLLPLDTLLLHTQTNKECDTTRRDRKYECRDNRIVIPMQHARQNLRRHNTPQVRRPSICHNPRVKSRRILGHLLTQRIDKDILRDGDAQRATKRVEEHDAGIGCWHIFLIRHDLYCDKGDLYTSPCADTGEDLVADPLTRWGRDFERVQHACADGEDGAAEPHERRVPTDNSDEAADDNG